MRNKILFGFLAVLLAATPVAANKDHFPGLIIQARFVLVTILPDSGVSADDILPNFSTTEDREAVAAVEDAFFLRDWRRFSETFDSEQADIIVEVRTARHALQPGAIPGRGRAPVFGGDLDTNVDVMEVSAGSSARARTMARDNADGFVLWRAAQKDGLKEPGLPLVQQFRKEVEEAARNKK